MHDETRPDLYDPFLPEQEHEPETEMKTSGDELDPRVFEKAKQLAERIQNQPTDWEQEPPEYELWIRPWDLLIEDDPSWYTVSDYERSDGGRPAETDAKRDSLA